MKFLTMEVLLWKSAFEMSAITGYQTSTTDTKEKYENNSET